MEKKYSIWTVMMSQEKTLEKTPLQLLRGNFTWKDPSKADRWVFTAFEGSFQARFLAQNPHSNFFLFLGCHWCNVRQNDCHISPCGCFFLWQRWSWKIWQSSGSSWNYWWWYSGKYFVFLTASWLLHYGQFGVFLSKYYMHVKTIETGCFLS